MSQILAILGMHRSGTSALTEALVAAGAWFGDPSLAAAATPNRPLGLLERKDFLLLTNAALAAQGCSWHDVSEFGNTWDSATVTRLRAEFAHSVLADFALHQLAVLKDPRLCLLMPLFRPLLQELLGIMIVRHPLEVAASLYARNALPLTTGVALWETYNRQAILSLRGVPSVIVQHRQLMRNPPLCISGLCEALSGLGVNALDPVAAAGAQVINQYAYRQRAPMLTSRPLAAAQRQFWKALREAKCPAEIPIQELSTESRKALEEHHVNPVVRPRSPNMATAS